MQFRHKVVEQDIILFIGYIVEQDIIYSLVSLIVEQDTIFIGSRAGHHIIFIGHRRQYSLAVVGKLPGKLPGICLEATLHYHHHHYTIIPTITLSSLLVRVCGGISPTMKPYPLVMCSPQLTLSPPCLPHVAN